MGQFEPTTVADWIGFLLVVAVALWGGWQMLEHYCENSPFMDEEPPRYPVRQQQNLADLIAGMQSLRKPLPQYKNQTPPASWNMGLQNHHMTPEELRKYNQGMAQSPNADPYREPVTGNWEELLALHGICAEDRSDIMRGSKLP